MAEDPVLMGPGSSRDPRMRFESLDAFWNAAFVAMVASARLRKIGLIVGFPIILISIPLLALPGAFVLLGLFGIVSGVSLICYAVVAFGAAWLAKVVVEDVKTDYIDPLMQTPPKKTRGPKRKPSLRAKSNRDQDN